jgi:hypothetical protein
VFAEGKGHEYRSPLTPTNAKALLDCGHSQSAWSGPTAVRFVATFDLKDEVYEC